jgi:hypothetical protein
VTHTPASDNPHVTEGVCTCPWVTTWLPFEGLTAPVPRQEIQEFSASCGLSIHRVMAAQAGRNATT